MFDVTYFGYGVSLVLVGWVVGMSVGIAFKILRSVSLF